MRLEVREPPSIGRPGVGRAAPIFPNGFVTPSFILLAGFLAALALLLGFSIYQNGAFTASIYAQFVTDHFYLGVLLTTLKLGAITTVICVPLGFVLAYGINLLRSNTLRLVANFLLFCPLLTSVIVRTYGWEVLLSDHGVVNSVLLSLHLTNQPVKLIYNFAGVVIALVEILLPFATLPIFASLARVGPRLHESAADLGANRWQTFLKVTLPLTMPAVVVACQLVFALTVSSFATAAIMGGGRVSVLANMIYTDVGAIAWPIAAVQACILVAFAGLIVGAFSLVARRFEQPVALESAGEAWRPARYGVVDWVVLAVVVALLIFLVAPIVIVVVFSFSRTPYVVWPPPGWSLRWYANLSGSGFGAPLVKSLILAAAVALGGVAIGLLAVVALVRGSLPRPGVIRSLLLSPLVSPKIAIGFAAFILLVQLQQYGSWWSLIWAHLLVVLPLTVTVVFSGLVRVDPIVEDAARDLGASRFSAFLRTVIPQIVPALVAAGLLAFILSFDETDMSIMIVNPDAATLPISMFIWVEKYSNPTLAALSSLLIVGAVALAAAVFVLLRRSSLLDSLFRA